jgi:hypothetical protein
MKTNFHKQKGSVGLFFLVLGMIMVTSLVQVLRTAARKAEVKNWVDVINGQEIILKGYNDYFDYDCFPDGAVTNRSIAWLTTNGFITSSLVFNPYNYTYNISYSRPSYTFNSIGQAIPDGKTIFTLKYKVTDQGQVADIKSILDLKHINYSYNTSTYLFTINQDHIVDSFNNENQLLNGNTSYTCN